VREKGVCFGGKKNFSRNTAEKNRKEYMKEGGEGTLRILGQGLKTWQEGREKNGGTNHPINACIQRVEPIARGRGKVLFRGEVEYE